MKAWQKSVLVAFLQHYRRVQPGPVRLEFVFFTRQPRQDLTNLLKAAEDALKTRAFADDCVVYEQVCRKEPVVEREEEGLRFRVLPYLGPAFQCHIGRGVPSLAKNPTPREEAEARADGGAGKHSRGGERIRARLSPQERCPESQGRASARDTPRPSSPEDR